MGVIRRGANGGFKGKAGSVVGSSWKSIDYIKGLYKKRTKPATEEQLMQQTKFTLLMRFLLPLKVFVRVGYGQRKTDTHTPMNVAFQDNNMHGPKVFYHLSSNQCMILRRNWAFCVAPG
ncbi:DUF6266 family protein [Parapedobacter sp. DT-150]|uniref:DUF6266 family protein n=1 Tax=Parapedobacter sp. DT-150 TaxID=3396162 RepID=UPI003F199AB8